MDWTHLIAFLAPYLPTVGSFLRDIFQGWMDAKYPAPTPSSVPLEEKLDPQVLATENISTEELKALIANRESNRVVKK